MRERLHDDRAARSEVLPAIAGGGRLVRGRVPGRRRGARRAAGRAEPRPRRDGGGRRDRARAKSWRAQLGGRCHPHEKFQTAVVKGAGRARRRDAGRRRRPRAPSSTARRARCPRWSARRCATTSRAATSRSTRWRPRCRPDDLGATYDFFGGYRDLRRGTVRVLHNLSFVEDPTRLLRAIRYEARLGFRMDAHTLSLARGLHRHAARRRPVLRAPARRAARPAGRAERAPRRSSAWPSSASTARCIRTSTPRAARRRWSSRPTSAMQGPLAEARATARAARLPVRGDGRPRGVRVARPPARSRRRDQDVVAAAVTLAPAIAERLSGDAPPAPSELHELLAGQPLEVLVMAIVLGRRAARSWRSACTPTWSGLAACASRSPATTCAQAGRAGVARDRRGAEADAGAEARRLRQRAATRSSRTALRLLGHDSGRLGSRPCPTGGTRCSGTASPATTRSTT